MKTTNEIKDKNIADIDPVIEERINKEKEFYKMRKMFYFDEKGGIHFPPIQYKDSSHSEWFKAYKIDIESVIRGYMDGYEAYCYIGKDFRIPNLTVENYFVLKNNFNVWEVYLGCKIGEIGEKWKPILTINIYNKNTIL